jgi:hypothetical protein
MLKKLLGDSINLKNESWQTLWEENGNYILEIGNSKGVFSRVFQSRERANVFLRCYWERRGVRQTLYL